MTTFKRFTEHTVACPDGCDAKMVKHGIRNNHQR